MHLAEKTQNSSVFLVLIFFLITCSGFTSTEAYDPLDPYGNITIIWDIMQWTGDGYIATVRIKNHQEYRHIQAPGWRLGWTWTKKEVIWDMLGGEAIEQGDCSGYHGPVPHCCKKSPMVVDFMPRVPYNLQVANCCRGGVLSSMIQDPAKSESMFQVHIGSTGTSTKTVLAPKQFTLGTPGPGYTCEPTKRVKPPSKFQTPDRRRVTQALLTWSAKCMYSQFLSQKVQSCCVSLSSFYNDTIVRCPKCTCGCPKDAIRSGTCAEPDSPELCSTHLGSPRNSLHGSLVQCTDHMCPIHVHWHLKGNYKLYWLVKVTITNFNHRKNYSQWNLVVQHPNLENLTRVFSFHFEPLINYAGRNDTGLLWGLEFYNDLLMSNGPKGNVQSELLFQKDKSSFTFANGWAFPHRIYFNGDDCVMPPPNEYPYLPNASTHIVVSLLDLLVGLVSLMALLGYV